jgi:hypothetical protein
MVRINVRRGVARLVELCRLAGRLCWYYIWMVDLSDQLVQGFVLAPKKAGP